MRAGLVRKAMLAHHLAKRKVSGVLPEGFVADVEDEEDLEALRKRLASWKPAKEVEGSMGGSTRGDAGPHAEDSHPSWVAKASTANRGEHLYVGRTADEVVAAMQPAALGQGIVEWVVQRYVAPPLLLEGRKFHIRAHLLVSGCTCCGSTRAWLHGKYHVVLVAGVEYSGFSKDPRTHLTNHCVQVEDPSYDESRQILLLSELDNIFQRAGLAAHVQSRMEWALGKALSAAASAPTGFYPLPHCFELMGADFVLEDRGTMDPAVWLLEVNAGPDLSIFGQRFQEQCVELVQDVLRVAVEPQLESDPPQTFADASQCSCKGLASSCGFSGCIWSAAPRASSPAKELAGFKRVLSIAGKWVQGLHEASGVSVRGPQSMLSKDVDKN